MEVTRCRARPLVARPRPCAVLRHAATAHACACSTVLCRYGRPCLRSRACWRSRGKVAGASTTSCCRPVPALTPTCCSHAFAIEMIRPEITATCRVAALATVKLGASDMSLYNDAYTTDAYHERCCAPFAQVRKTCLMCPAVRCCSCLSLLKLRARKVCTMHSPTLRSDCATQRCARPAIRTRNDSQALTFCT